MSDVASTEKHDERSARRLAAEHLDLHAVVVGGKVAQQGLVLILRRCDGCKGLIEVLRLHRLIGGRPGGNVERPGFRRFDQHRSHDGEVLKPFERASLLRGRAIVELRSIDLGGQVQQDAHFVL